MELNELSNTIIGCAISPGLGTGSNALSSDSFVLFVTFVVKQSCTSVRVLALATLSLVTQFEMTKSQKEERDEDAG